MTLTQFALRSILMFDAVTCAIPGARTARQALENAAAADVPALDAQVMRSVQAVYDAQIRPHVHAHW